MSGLLGFVLGSGVAVVTAGAGSPSVNEPETSVAVLSSAVGPSPTLISLAASTTVAEVPDLPGWLAFVHPPAATATTLPAWATVSTAAPQQPLAPPGPITYTVQPGDTLTGIARWFELHGYRDLYEANRSVIGADPNLIFPGQTITIGPDAVRMGSSAPST